jgi:glycogenin glucosyltransferase
MSRDPTPFHAPERYPDPPKNMYYEVPKTPTHQKPAPIFPWEKNPPKPTRVFPEDLPAVSSPLSAASGSSPPAEERTDLVTSTAPNIDITPADIWQSFSSSTRNAWDDMPEIQKYIGSLRKSRKGNIQILQNVGVDIETVSSPGGQSLHERAGLRLTDFPTEFERPSLPVTPAPIRRPRFWGAERDDEGELPAAEGVPAQADWVCLQLWLCHIMLLSLTL